MIRISYSTLNQVRQCRQWWVCKISGLSKVDFPWFTSGKEAHNIIQAHISGKSSLLHPELAEKLDGLYFPVVEEKDFD